MGSVVVENLSKEFGKVRAVNNINLKVNDGEFLVLLGPSGCGKSTLLRMISGLEFPTYGKIIIGNKDVTRVIPKERDISMVFQNYALYPHMTIGENIRFPLVSRGYKKREIEEKVKWASELLKISELMDRKPVETSGGQRQRTALARALVRDPSAFLMDEPLSNLDAKLRHSAREEIRQFQNQVKITTIYVTHDQIEAMGLGDRIVIMENGIIKQMGTPKEIYDKPANLFVAKFIGSPAMNIIDKDNLYVGFRPENLEPENIFKGIKDNSFKLDLNVNRIEFLGNDTLIYCSSELTNEIITSKIISNENLNMSEGKRYNFYVESKNIFKYSKETEELV
tara:strand:+ start:810 stop:1823 length:1014 start_codon:yes stop_codon:yes gene_type:complete